MRKYLHNTVQLFQHVLGIHILVYILICQMINEEAIVLIAQCRNHLPFTYLCFQILVFEKKSLRIRTASTLGLCEKYG